MDTTDPLEYTEADGAGVSDDDDDDKDHAKEDGLEKVPKGDTVTTTLTTTLTTGLAPHSLQHMADCTVPLTPVHVAAKLVNGDGGSHHDAAIYATSNGEAATNGINNGEAGVNGAMDDIDWTTK